MSFQSLSFLLFLAVTVCTCLGAARRSRTAGMCLLGIACGVFCLWGFDRQAFSGFLVLLGGALVTYAAAAAGPARRGPYLLAACWHIGVLLWFKCVGFFDSELYHGWMPLGLSFYTFQQLWLLAESRRGNLSLREEGTGVLLLYTFFFPAVTSGPILKPQNFFPQLQGEKFLRPDSRDVSAGLYAITMGMVKKVLLADPLGVMVSNGWAVAGDLTAPAAWIVILGYTLQLYLDFSGYCDIAAGCARLLGLRLPVNFDSPYRSLSVTEFWKRWHMTLTTFLRECLYFPLGGSKKGEVRTYLNIMIIFLVSGFWHGAGWTFIVWGALHGLAQVVERLWGKGRDRLPALIRWALTFAFVNIAWVFFRAPDFAQAAQLLRAAVTGGFAMPESWLAAGLFGKEVGALQILIPAIKPWTDILRVAVLYGIGMLTVLLPRNVIAQTENFRPRWWQGAALVILTGWSILSFTGITTFIYSNF